MLSWVKGGNGGAIVPESMECEGGPGDVRERVCQGYCIDLKKKDCRSGLIGSFVGWGGGKPGQAEADNNRTCELHHLHSKGYEGLCATIRLITTPSQYGHEHLGSAASQRDQVVSSTCEHPRESADTSHRTWYISQFRQHVGYQRSAPTVLTQHFASNLARSTVRWEVGPSHSSHQHVLNPHLAGRTVSIAHFASTCVGSRTSASATVTIARFKPNSAKPTVAVARAGGLKLEH